MNSRTILFIHQAFPGQFGNLARSLLRDGHKVYALAMNPHKNKVPGVTLFQYKLVRKPEQEQLPYLLRDLDSKLLRGESAYQAMIALRDQGLVPDVVYAHPGWGEALFVKDVWPKTRFVVYAEWYYNRDGQEVNFDPEFRPLTPQEEMRLRLKNTSFLNALTDADAAIAPTEWQKSRYPKWAKTKIKVVHDGLDTAELARVIPKRLKNPGKNQTLSFGMPIVTYAARHLEPVRGFHTFMRALPHVLSERPDAHILILGQDAGVRSGYGRRNEQNTTWRESMKRELGDRVDWERVHFLGMVPRPSYLSLLSLSACHVYLTIPFILSWSFLEAAALGLPLVASATPPVEEFSGLKGLELVKFGDPEMLSSTIVDVLSRPIVRTPNDLISLGLDQESTLSNIKAILLPSKKTSSSRSTKASESKTQLDSTDKPKRSRRTSTT